MKKKIQSRPAPNDFKVVLTDVNKDEIAKKSIELKSSLRAIKWWIKDAVFRRDQTSVQKFAGSGNCRPTFFFFTKVLTNFFLGNVCFGIKKITRYKKIILLAF